MALPTTKGPILIVAELAARLEKRGLSRPAARANASRMLQEELSRHERLATAPLLTPGELVGRQVQRGHFPDPLAAFRRLNQLRRHRTMQQNYLLWIMGMTDPVDVDEYISTTWGIQ